MAKRFIDTSLYSDPWFRKLPLSYKQLWNFLWLNVDYAGVWKVDFELVAFCLGNDAGVNQAEALQLFNEGKDRVEEFKDGEWYLTEFVPFQNNELKVNSPTHRNIIKLLKHHGLLDRVSALCKHSSSNSDSDSNSNLSLSDENQSLNELTRASPQATETNPEQNNSGSSAFRPAINGKQNHGLKNGSETISGFLAWLRDPQNAAQYQTLSRLGQSNGWTQEAFDAKLDELHLTFQDQDGKASQLRYPASIKRFYSYTKTVFSTAPPTNGNHKQQQEGVFAGKW